MKYEPGSDSTTNIATAIAKAVQRALEELDYFTSYLNILGVYPADRER